MTCPGKISAQVGVNPRSDISRGRCLNHLANEAVSASGLALSQYFFIGPMDLCRKSHCPLPLCATFSGFGLAETHQVHRKENHLYCFFFFLHFAIFSMHLNETFLLCVTQMKNCNSSFVLVSVDSKTVCAVTAIISISFCHSVYRKEGLLLLKQM